MQMKSGTIREKKGNMSVVTSFDQVTFVDKIASDQFSDASVRARDRDLPGQGLQLTNDGGTWFPSKAKSKTTAVLCSAGVAKHMRHPPHRRLAASPGVNSEHSTLGVDSRGRKLRQYPSGWPPLNNILPTFQCLCRKLTGIFTVSYRAGIRIKVARAF
jgi:hypothetical protein